MIDTVPEQTLRSALHGTLPTDPAREIETHVRECAKCAAQLASLAEGELLLSACTAGQAPAAPARRSAIFLAVAAAAGVGIAFLLKAWSADSTRFRSVICYA